MDGQERKMTKAEIKAYKLSIYAKKYFMVDGEIKSQVRGKCNPMPEQWVLAEELLKLLHRRKNWDGSFRVILHGVREEFRDPISKVWMRYVPTIFETQYVDKDGDVKFVIEYAEDIVTIMDQIGVTRMADEAEEGYREMKKVWDAVEVSPDQTFKQALGEKPITGIDAPPSMVSGA